INGGPMRKICVLVSLVLAAAGAAWASEIPPHAQAVENIWKTLEYSGYQVLVKPDVRLSIDFDKQQWTLHNAHAFDADGNVVLEQGRFGLCAELSTYAFEHLPPEIKDNYEIKFANVTESDYFSRDQSNHIVLLMREKATDYVFLLDPSF